MRSGMTVEEAYTLLTPFGVPNLMQRDVWRSLVDEEEGGLLLLAPSGTGKTEAVMVPGLAMGRRVFIILPASSLVDDHFGRFTDMLRRISAEDSKRSYALIIDAGTHTRRLVWRNGRSLTRHPQRQHGYHGDIVVTTLDTFLCRFFGFGEPRNSYYHPLHIRHGLREGLYCFDEAHAFDAATWTNFHHLLQALFERGLDVAVMTATMPPEFAADLHFLEKRDWVNYPNRKALNESQEHEEPRRELHYIPCAPEDVVERLVEQALQHHSASRRTIVTAETVPDAVAVFEALGGRRGESMLLYHERLTSSRREKVYPELKRRESAGEGYLLIATRAIEVGCDLDAHTLITQLCSPAQLIRRVGRCNRQGKMEDARVIVVGRPSSGNLPGLSDEDRKAYCVTLAQLSGQAFDATAVQAHIVRQPSPDDRVEIAFDILYEYLYEASVENKPLHDKGLMTTPSWEPSLTLCTGLDNEDRPINPVKVSVEKCATDEEGLLTPDCRLLLRTLNRHNQRFEYEPLSGGWRCAYSMHMVALAPSGEYDEQAGYAHPPKLFLRRGHDWDNAYRRLLLHPGRGDTERDSWLWYMACRKEE